MNSQRDDEDKLLSARVRDAIRLAQDRYESRFIGFLDEHGRSIARAASAGWENVRFFGGYDDAERVYFCAYPEYCDLRESDYPITAVTVTSRKEASLSHRDYLGSIMSAGITREKVGDILCEPSRAVIFVSSSVADYILNQIDKVGGEGVRLSVGFSAPLPSAHTFKTIRDTVASARLDCIVSALCGISRSKAIPLIEGGAVTVDGAVCCNVSAKVREESKISVRGNGKYIVDSTGSMTRKGRIILCARKYI